MKKIKKKTKSITKSKKLKRNNDPLNEVKNNFKGKLGAFSRFYPTRLERNKVIENIKSINLKERSSNDWWKLGEYTIFNSILDENEALLNEGIASLTEGANHEHPSAACLLDLGWILMFKNMDVLALPHLQRAAEITPNSRDVLSLLSTCYLKNNNKEMGIKTLKDILKLYPNSEREKELLEILNNETDIEKIKRQHCLLTKINPSDPDFFHMDDNDQKKISKQIFKQLLFVYPDDPELIKGFGTIEYLLNNLENAKIYFEKYLDQNPRDAEILTLMGLIYKKFYDDRFKEEKFYLKALEADENHILALTNLSSLLQDKADLNSYHDARTYLARALDKCDEKNPHYSIILDLFGSNVGVIDRDFETERNFHLKAFNLNPNQPIFAMNFLVSTLSANKINDALQFYSIYKNKLKNFSQFGLIKSILETLKTNLKTPNAFLAAYEMINEEINNHPSSLAKIMFKDITFPLLKKSWFYKDYIEQELSKIKLSQDELEEMKCSYYQQIGMLVTNHDDYEFALEIWEDGINQNFNTDVIDSLLINKSVVLQKLDRSEESLEILNSIDLKKVERGFTVLGNFKMNELQHEQAINAYKKALKFNPKFILPISNGIECCKILNRPDLLDPFLSEIRENWKKNKRAEFLKSKIYFLQGKPLSAFNNFKDYILENGEILNPEELYEKVINPEKDISLLFSSDTQDHFMYAESCILSRNFEHFFDVYNLIETSIEWTNGDWQVLKSETLRRQNKLKESIDVIDNMIIQPPTLVTKALCFLEDMQFTEAENCANEIINFDLEAAQYSHLEGKPISIAKAIISLKYLREGELSKALELSKSAINDDISCAIARTSYANICIETDEIDLAIQNLEQGLKHNPGSVPMIKQLIEILVEQNFLKEADERLEISKEIIQENGFIGTVEKLSELIALKKLTKYESKINLNDPEYSWSKDLSDLSKKWLISYLEIESKNLNLLEAKLFYLSKIIEKELGDRVFKPFKKKLIKPYDFVHEKFEDFSRFLTGEYAPSLGAMHRIFRASSKLLNEDEPKLIFTFKKFFEKKLDFLNNDLLKQLNSLSHLRNSLAHVGEPDSIRIEKAIKMLIDKNNPGKLISFILRI